jgi:hypothetical protein
MDAQTAALLYSFLMAQKERDRHSESEVQEKVNESLFEKFPATKKVTRNRETSVDVQLLRAQPALAGSTNIDPALLGNSLDVEMTFKREKYFLCSYASCELTDGTNLNFSTVSLRVDKPTDTPEQSRAAELVEESLLLDFFKETLVVFLRSPKMNLKTLRIVNSLNLTRRHNFSVESYAKLTGQLGTIRTYRPAMTEAILSILNDVEFISSSSNQMASSVMEAEEKWLEAAKKYHVDNCKKIGCPIHSTKKPKKTDPGAAQASAAPRAGERSKMSSESWEEPMNTTD